MSWYAATLLQKESLCHHVSIPIKYPSAHILLGIKSSPSLVSIGRFNGGPCGKREVEEAAIYENFGAPYLKFTV